MSSDEAEDSAIVLKLRGPAFEDHFLLDQTLRSSERPDGITKLEVSSCRLTCFIQPMSRFHYITSLSLSNNKLQHIPQEIFAFQNLEEINLSRNEITDCEIKTRLPRPRPRALTKLKRLILSENRLKFIPDFVFECLEIADLFMAQNNLEQVDDRIGGLVNLTNLYLGANELKNLPKELGSLRKLQHLHLCDNKLEQVPSELSDLTDLRCLELHNNNLHTLPQSILDLNQLVVLSLRSNPLVVDFVEQHVWNVPSLQELAGRSFLQNYTDDWQNNLRGNRLPPTLIQYLSSARRCENPQCSGVYFASHVESVVFRDFCGKYRLPLLQFLCSPSCTDEEICSRSRSCHSTNTSQMINKVLMN